MSNELMTTEVEYRRGVFNLLHSLKNSMPEERFTEIINILQEKMENVPSNNLEQSKQLFFEVTNEILKELNQYYEITHEELVSNDNHSDVFKLVIDEETAAMIEKFEKYKNMARFRDSFLQSYNSGFWRKFRSNYYYDRIRSLCTKDEDDNLILVRNKIPLSGDFCLPHDSRGRLFGLSAGSTYFSNIYQVVKSEKRYIQDLSDDYSTLNDAVDAFNERLKESLREEHMKFGVSILKELLSKMIVPVSLIEDEALRNLCVEHNRDVFVKEPSFEDLLFLGSSVHIYSSHDMSDDASYVAKPIIISDTLPADTEELKYLGVGQYTDYDNESPRSLDGANPYIINNNIFVKASHEDFKQLIPEELVEEIEICKKLVESLEKPLEKLEMQENTVFSAVVDFIKQDRSLDPKAVVEKFLTTSKLLEGQSEEDSSSASTFIDNDLYSFERTSIDFSKELLTKNAKHPNGFVVVRDSSGTIGAIRIDEEGVKRLYTIHQDIDKALRALQLPPGLYSIYKFVDRHSTKQQALLTIHSFAG
ncbi:hypothetical protein COJ01_17980 [Priestia megaterium]|uniref:hypothetical protein n=1 Tax=Priestia megaterium TaxID=1404 RepID=UPI000BF8BF27|nr:hypothetical protein [Priestia megaterium]PFK99935.1 hypothetical protein COJ01_17980 [Priestia megaterium]